MTNHSQTLERPRSMKTFFVILFGQFISLIGSGLTGFALGIWIYDQTGQATPFALTALFATLPRVLLAPFAGVLADRYNRRRIMILADSADALVTAVAALLLFSGNLAVWHIYLIALSSSAFSSFQEPAYTASVTMLVPKEQLARAGGMTHTTQALQGLITPVLAGALFGLIGMRGIILIDFVSYFFAIGALLFVRIPQPEAAEETDEEKGQSMLKKASFGWRYLRQRPGLFWMLWYFANMNFFLNLAGVLAIPMVLSFADATAAGLISSVGGGAALIGGLIISAWGGPQQKRVPFLILMIVLTGIGFLISSLEESVFLIALGRGWMLLFIPVASALSQAIFQTKVAPEVQGRVFSIRMMIGQSIMPLAFLIAGPLADNVFGPMMSAGGALADSLIGGLLGVGASRGIALIYLISFVFITLFSVAVYAHPRIRNVESELPDAIPDTGEQTAPLPGGTAVAHPQPVD